VSDPAVIVGLGARTSVGLDLAATDAAVRANINAFALCPWLRSPETGEALLLARLAVFPEGASAVDRMREMGLAAASEALGSCAADSPEAAPLPVVLSVPPARPGFSEGAQSDLVRDLVSGLPCRIDGPRSALVATGHEGGLAALDFASRVTSDPKVPACLIVGVESYLDVDALDWYDGLGRLKRDGIPTGFIPGEGAGAVLVARAMRGGGPAVALVAAGRAEEPDPWYSGRPTLGSGLTRTIRAAFESPAMPTERAGLTYCDMNGETWRPDEWAYAYLRTASRHGEPIDLRAPASSWGDVGAATGPLLVALAARELLRALDPTAAALLWAASDLTPYRSACLLRRFERN
jgi:3-oxoacyl-[acyl-carrier-protein] synthase-1